MSEVAYINDAPLTDLGLYVTAHPRWLSSAAYSFPVATLPGSMGGIASDVATVEPMGFSITARLVPASLTAREEAINAVQQRLKGLLEVRYADQPDKVLEGWLDSVEVEPQAAGQGFVDPGLLVALNFRSARPYKRDRYGRAVAFGSTRTEVKLGDLPSAGLVRIMGAATNPVLTYRGTNGEALKTLGFTITLNSTDFLEVDLGKRTIYKSVSGTRTRVDSVRTSGYFFNLDPHDGTPEFDDFPTLEVSAGSGLITYHRNWSS